MHYYKNVKAYTDEIGHGCNGKTGGIPDPFFYYRQLYFLTAAFTAAGTVMNDQHGHPFSLRVWCLIAAEEPCLNIP